MVFRHKVKEPVTGVPPDIDSPPFYIPVKSISRRFSLMQELGTGSFGSVILAKIHQSALTDKKPQYHNTLLDEATIPFFEQENFYNKQQGLLAIKTMMTRLPTLNDYTRVREIKFILSMPAHKNLLQIFELFIDDTNFQLHIVMECMEQNLYQLMRQRRKRVFSLPSLKSVLSQILAGIKHIHSHNFFHRDVKPENILISPSNHFYTKGWLVDGNYNDNYVVKIADYGLARHVGNKSPYTAYVSTRWYRSPEILLRKGFYSKPLDIWAFGCVAVEVATFKPLFPGSDEMDQIWKILEVLGTPHTMPETLVSGYQSHGGNWEQAKVLAARLNLKFPYVEGIDIESIMEHPHLSSLRSVVKACLTWDPKSRATADELSQMPYFQGTPVAEQAPLVECSNDENHEQTTCDHSSALAQQQLTKKLRDSMSLAPTDIINNAAGESSKVSLHEFLQEARPTNELLGSKRVSDSTSLNEDGKSQSHASGSSDEGSDRHNIAVDFDEPEPEGDFDIPASKELIADLTQTSLQLPGIDDCSESSSCPPDADDSFSNYYVASTMNFEATGAAAGASLRANDSNNYVHDAPARSDEIPLINRHNHILEDMSMGSDNSQNHVPRVYAMARDPTEFSTPIKEHDYSQSFTHAGSLTF
ncbi:LAMI_0E12178g1_1 [Lachancea mirantina]|uniref:LAMI_0E12178g1_1 n=1 Tax=Lachancea mirantina TaxID=1230905 RepID=A0A1G4JPW6_9SACH|nr:LAMI_0E12178g1_1 [Lachancea mirantina]